MKKNLLKEIDFKILSAWMISPIITTIGFIINFKLTLRICLLSLFIVFLMFSYSEMQDRVKAIKVRK